LIHLGPEPIGIFSRSDAALASIGAWEPLAVGSWAPAPDKKTRVQR